MTTTINTDLLTPLAAYLRLRDAGRAGFILESVERGSARPQLVDGSRRAIVDFDESKGLGLPIVGDSRPMTTWRGSSQRCRCPRMDVQASRRVA